MDYSALWREWNLYLTQLPNFLLALLVLLVGWMVVKGVANTLQKVLIKAKLDQRILPEADDQKHRIAKIISRVIYYVALSFVFIMFFNILNLHIAATPLVDMLSVITASIPNVLKAALILLLGLVIASILRVAIRKV